MDARTAEPPNDSEPTTEEMNLALLRIMRGVNAQAFRSLGNKVLGGPFSGMVIPERNQFWDDGNSGTKLLGIYEFELYATIEHAIWRQPKSIINVGCAEGYYAIGLARMLSQVAVHAFDIRENVLHLLCEYAALNGVADRVKAGIGCQTPEAMQLPEVAFPRLYVMDAEGDELELIDLERCPALGRSDLIIECHDFMRPGTSSQIADRLSATHRVEVIHHEMPDLKQLQFLRHSPSIMSVLVAVEKRPTPCFWLACWANQRKE